MIPYDRLSAAAETVSALLLAELERDFVAGSIREPTARFQRKLRPVRRRADHPYFYRTMRQAAGFFLALLLAGSTWIAVDTEARAAFVGWVKGVYEEYFTYQFQGEGLVTEIGTDTYRPSWLPEGYLKSKVMDLDTDIIVQYTNAENKNLTLIYTNSETPSAWYLNMEDIVIEEGTVNGEPADYFISTNPKTSSGVLWVDTEENIAFQVIAYLDKEELTQVAESVIRQ